jgi:large subunit ribosomal protein L35
MPKMKSNRAATKRFRVTPKGKVLFQPSGLRHNLESKSGKKKRELSALRELSKYDKHTVLRMLGKR